MPWVRLHPSLNPTNSGDNVWLPSGLNEIMVGITINPNLVASISGPLSILNKVLFFS